MSDPFIGEIRLLSFGFAPKGWALANGQLLPINQNQALFSLLGTTFGGDGRVNFALPDLRGRVPIHSGGGHTQGERGGEEAHTLSISELPTHHHQLSASAGSATTSQTGPDFMPAQSVGSFAYAAASNLVAMDVRALATVGGSQAHTNMQPYLTVSACIALVGIFPSPS